MMKIFYNSLILNVFYFFCLTISINVVLVSNGILADLVDKGVFKSHDYQYNLCNFLKYVRQINDKLCDCKRCE